MDIVDLTTSNVFEAIEHNWTSMNTGSYNIRTSVYSYFVIVYKSTDKYGSVICMGYRGVLLAFRTLWEGTWQTIQYIVQ